MLKHGRAGVPMEVMGLMLGEFVDEYTVQVIDVFAMPQSGTTVTVESVDHVFQQKMIEMLKQTGRCSFVSCSHVVLHVALSSLIVLYCFLPSLDPKWWSGGTIRTLVLAAGFPAWISTHSRHV